MTKIKGKIAVLMSGGIDSSFSAYHLRKQGYDVFGVTFINFNKKLQERDTNRAKKIAREIEIPHFVFDIRKEFKERIINRFIEDYKKGITPNPCPFCNREIKFGLILEKTIKLGAKYIATGHYVRKKEINKGKQKEFLLFKAKDKNKDQSYFLWQLTQKELKNILFPLGDFTKKEVFNEIKKSKIGKFFGEKDYHESQDICFLNKKSLKEFLEQKIGKKPGPILDKRGKKIGEHKGIYFFTIGQRTGLRISAKSPNQEPFYVIKINKEKNALIVGKEDDLYQKHLFVKNINWLISPSSVLSDFSVKIRYLHKPARARITMYDKKKRQAGLEFKIPQRAITPGQHAVFYKRDMLLGGGVIVNSK